MGNLYGMHGGIYGNSMGNFYYKHS
jgi:hypothetical protein